MGSSIECFRCAYCACELPSGLHGLRALSARLGQRIGKGRFGEVFECWSTRTGESSETPNSSLRCRGLGGNCAWTRRSAGELFAIKMVHKMEARAHGMSQEQLVRARCPILQTRQPHRGYDRSGLSQVAEGSLHLRLAHPNIVRCASHPGSSAQAWLSCTCVARSACSTFSKTTISSIS